MLRIHFFCRFLAQYVHNIHKFEILTFPKTKYRCSYRFGERSESGSFRVVGNRRRWQRNLHSRESGGNRTSVRYHNNFASRRVMVGVLEKYRNAVRRTFSLFSPASEAVQIVASNVKSFRGSRKNSTAWSVGLFRRRYPNSQKNEINAIGGVTERK